MSIKISITLLLFIYGSSLQTANPKETVIKADVYIFHIINKNYCKIDEQFFSAMDYSNMRMH